MKIFVSSDCGLDKLPEFFCLRFPNSLRIVRVASDWLAVWEDNVDSEVGVLCRRSAHSLHQRRHQVAASIAKET